MCVAGAISLSNVSNEICFVFVAFGLTDCEQKAITRVGTPPLYKHNMASEKITHVAQRQAPFYWQCVLKIGLVVITPLLHPHEGISTGDENKTRW